MTNLKNLITGIIFSFFFLPSLFSQSATSPEITAEDIRSHISFLASDELEGRYTGTPGSTAAADYIREQFVNAGLELMGENGFQNFEVVVRVRAGEGNLFEINGQGFMAGQDFTPFPFTRNASLMAEVVFAGYGFEISQDSLNWNDYEAVDVAGKWVMILRGDPEMEKPESRFALYGDDRDKVLIARDKGAAGVILISGKKFDASDDLVPMYFDKTQSTAGIPVVQIKRSLADIILAAGNMPVDSLESSLISEMRPHSISLNTKINAITEVIQERVIARNVIGLLEGSDPVLKNSYIVIGAHYDHLGMGGTGSGSRFMDSLAVHNGADDNASGVAGVLELASFLAAEGASLKRSIVFVAFDAEELGLLGSRYFVSNPLIDLKEVVAMVNFDMIGRLKEENPAVMVGGTGTSVESEEILGHLETGGIKLSFSPEGYGPSDHAAFYAENITVFFFSTGAHEDYHTPDDDWDRINYEGTKEVLEITRQLAEVLAGRDELLTFREAGPKQQEGRGGYRFKVTLGIMPDFTSTVEGGLGVGGVKKDGPAYKGGILKGDVITAIDGLQINDIYDYMNRLKKLQPGQRISVDVLRDDKKQVLIIEL
jgi:hypothetical protein